MRKNSNGVYTDKHRKRFKSFNNNGSYIPGSAGKGIKFEKKPPEICKETRMLICGCIDNALKKGKTIEEAIAVIAKSERIQSKLSNYYFYRQEIGKGLEFEDIIKHIYRDREIERKLSEMDSVR